MFRLSGKTTILGAPEAASSFLADVGNEPKWQNDIVHLQLLEGQAGKVGSRYERVQVVAGKNIKTVNELVEHEPGKRVVFRAVGKVIEYKVEFVLAGRGTSTDVEMKLEGEMLGFASMFEGMASDELRDAIPGNFERLKTVLK